MIYIFDLDGTLCDLSHRLHYIQQEPKDWDKFFAACERDEPIRETLAIAEALFGPYRLAFLTGRPESIRAQTRDWLVKHCRGAAGSDLLMRPSGDHRPDYVVKRELLAQLRGLYPSLPILGVFEDRRQVVAMYRAQGLRVFQVADGNY
jgi:phosphoglycolate phosphatase-like HAD superfamily hydrolase